MKQTILNRLFATHLSDSAKGTDVSIQPIFQKKRPPVMLILLPTLFILLCGSLVSCQASQEDSDLAAITQNKTSDSSVSDQDHENQEILNSVTYIDIDGVYFPISYVNHGEQLLSGDVGPYSAFAESLLKEAPPASGLNKIAQRITEHFTCIYSITLCSLCYGRKDCREIIFANTYLL